MNAHASVACCIGSSDGFQACLLENMIVRGSLNFFFPKSHIALRQAVMFRAAMPKAAIYKDAHSFFAKSEIRVAGQLQMPPPSFDFG